MNVIRALSSFVSIQSDTRIERGLEPGSDLEVDSDCESESNDDQSTTSESSFRYLRFKRESPEEESRCSSPSSDSSSAFDFPLLDNCPAIVLEAPSRSFSSLDFPYSSEPPREATPPPYMVPSQSFPVNTLPPEILCMTFALATQFDSRTALSVLLTCKYWHKLFIHDPTAWSYVSLQKRSKSLPAAAVNTILERSRNTPLHVSHFPPGRSLWEKTDYNVTPAFSMHSCTIGGIRQLENHLFRIVNLNISVPARFIPSSWLLLHPAPELRFLSLCVIDIGRPPDPYMTVLPSLFGSNSPKLEVLQMEACRLPWCEESYPSTLRELAIDLRVGTYGTYQPDDPEGSRQIEGRGFKLIHPNDRSLPAALKPFSSRLQILSLIDCWDMRETSIDASEDRVELPNLHSLRLERTLIDRSALGFGDEAGH